VICSHVREEVAVALLTGHELAPEASDHLSRCEVCAAEAADLARLPDLLAITRPDSIDEPEPDEAGLHRLLSAAAVTRRRGRRRVLAGLAAAAAAVVLLGGGMIGWRASQSDAGPPLAGPTAPVQLSAGPSTQGVSAAVTLTPAAWGAELAMKVTGVPPQTKCTLVVVTNDGTTVRAATWWATYAGTAEVHATVAVDVDAIQRIDVVDAGTQQTLLQVPVA
jgi:hypothetical protein